MKALLDKIAAELTGCKATVIVDRIPKGIAPWVKLTIQVASTDGMFIRPLLAVIAPPSRWPVVVEQYHSDPRTITGYRYEWGVNPNEKRTDNPTTIDNLAELEKVIRGILSLDECKQIVSRMS